MSASSIGRSLEPRNWFDMPVQMESIGLGDASAEEDARNAALAADNAAREATLKAEEEEKRKLALRKGRRSTILTGSLGLPEDTGMQRKTLLGS